MFLNLDQELCTRHESGDRCECDACYMPTLLTCRANGRYGAPLFALPRYGKTERDAARKRNPLLAGLPSNEVCASLARARQQAWDRTKRERREHIRDKRPGLSRTEMRSLAKSIK